MERYWIDHCIGIARDAGNVDAAQDATKELDAALVRAEAAERERDENEGAFKVWRRRCEAAEARLALVCDPRRWTREMSDAWHRNIPDTQAAFKALQDAVIEAMGK